MTLREAAPKDFSKFANSLAGSMGEESIVASYQTIDRTLPNYKVFPGPYSHVLQWWELQNGYAVGYNQNPILGPSFPVVWMR